MKRHLFLEEETSEEPLINLTPLIDVVFVVLIAFMIIVPMVNVQDISLAQGGNNLLPCSTTSPFALTVRSDNTLWLNGQEVSLQELPHHLQRARREYPHATPQLIHDRRAQFGTYQTLKIAFENAGFEHLDLIVEP